MEVEIIRRTPGDIGTQGTLTILDPEAPWSCDTLELPWYNNKRHISCVMPGSYRAWLWFSPTFGLQVVRLEDKNGRQDCLLHSGNFAGDVAAGRITQVHGCTEVGRGFGMLLLPGGKIKQWGILNSRTALAELVRRLGKGNHTVTYRWAPGCAPEDPRDLNPESPNYQLVKGV